jgi:REP element-mobilizing transposase RayT
MTFRSIHDPTHLYFVTASVVEWIPLFKNPKYAEIVLNSLSWMQKEKRLLLFAFVIMPTHAHAIIKPENQSIGGTVQQLGSFTAHEILKKVREDGKTDWLKTFEQEKRDPRHKHSIWQDVQAKNIFSMEVLEQKRNTSIKTQLRKNGNWRRTDQIMFIQVRGIMITGKNPSLKLLI